MYPAYRSEPPKQATPPIPQNSSHQPQRKRVPFLLQPINPIIALRKNIKTHAKKVKKKECDLARARTGDLFGGVNRELLTKCHDQLDHETS
jgi:hypothetical protein